MSICLIDLMSKTNIFRDIQTYKKEINIRKPKRCIPYPYNYFKCRKNSVIILTQQLLNKIKIQFNILLKVGFSNFRRSSREFSPVILNDYSLDEDPCVEYLLRFNFLREPNWNLS